MADQSASEDSAIPPAKRSKPARLREIAEYLQLSTATVSMVINDVPLAQSLSAETRARVQAAAKLFNYRPNLLARSLSKRESRTVGVIAPESSDGYFTRVMRGVEGALLDAGYLYFTVSHLGREDLIREYPQALIQRGVDGLIFVNTPVHEHPGVPSVSITSDPGTEGFTSILSDQAGGVEAALQHLHHLGHRRVLLVRGHQWSQDAAERFDAMLAAANRLRLPTPPELQMTLGDNQLSPEVAFRGFRDRLAAGVDFSAIFAFNDFAALAAIRAMADLGLRCPDDISVVGVDDITTSAYMIPRLTTTAQPLERMGAAAVEHLLARIQRPEDVHQTRVLFPMSLIVRDSTAPAPTPNPARTHHAGSTSTATTLTPA